MVEGLELLEAEREQVSKFQEMMYFEEMVQTAVAAGRVGAVGKVVAAAEETGHCLRDSCFASQPQV